MALSAVSIVVGKLADITLKKALELYDVGDRIDPMKMELNLITGFLKDADAKRNKNPQVKAWVNELRDLAYRTEDTLDTFLVDIEGKKPPGSSMISKLMRCCKNPMKVNDLCDEIKKITVLLKTLYERGAQMGIKDIKEENCLIPTQFRPADPCHFDDSAYMVGLVTEKKQIISHLNDTKILRRTVLSIVGPGGLGKTTLAHEVYKSHQFNKKFDCATWLSVSQKWDEKILRRQILYSIEPAMKEKNPPLIDEDVLKELKMSLACKRYLIILDDVWTVDLWEQLRPALPDPNNASRVLITTRNLDVAMAADCDTQPFKLNYLNDDESLALLFTKALHQPVRPDNYRPDLKVIAERLIKKCAGLPLALVVLGGILSRRPQNSTAWQEVENTLDWHNKDGENCSQILALSYEDLPYELKPCFLYFASFPEDYEISASHITKMWVAEGFIPKDGAGTMEDRAMDCLAELVQRCLVNVNKKSLSGRCKTCKMHDLLRDLAIHEAKSNHFLTVFSAATGNDYQGDVTLMRRAAFQFCTSIEYGLLSSKTRSLICFGKYQKLTCEGFKLLRVLNFNNYFRGTTTEDLNDKKFHDEGWLKCLIHLRFLGFRHCRNYFGFQRFSFSYLKNFETFDLTEAQIYFPMLNHKKDEPNDSLWEVPTLRNVMSTYPIRGPSQWCHLKNIQTLKWVRLENVSRITNTINLRKLGIRIGKPDIWEDQSVVAPTVRGNVWDVLKDLLTYTPFLTSLSIQTGIDDYKQLGNVLSTFGPNGTHNLSCHEKLQKLHLEGQWSTALNIEMLPTNLVKFTLEKSFLIKDPMPVLERLQSLRKLQLLYGSYNGEKLSCSAGGFPSLEKLIIRYLRFLSEWEIKEGAMPNLNHLTIEYCDKLHTLPELQHVRRLQELVVAGDSVELNRRIESEDRYKIKHIPSVRLNPRRGNMIL